MEAWAEDESKTVELFVQQGQQELGMELIKFMYTGEVSYTKGTTPALVALSLCSGPATCCLRTIVFIMVAVAARLV